MEGNMKKYIAEVFGTFVLVFIGCSVVILGAQGGLVPSTSITIGLAFGLAVTAAAYSIGPVSGAHLNPAVTLGVFLAGRMKASDVVPYMVAQIVGATLAALVLYIIVSGKAGGYDIAVNGFAASGWDEAKGYSMMSALISEIVATFVFVTVILGVTNAKHETAFAGLVIGLTLAILHFAFIPVSGSSLNPARSIGPALFAGSGAMGMLWLYIVGPLVGGALAGVVAKMGLLEKD
jgi:aquaporin Z